MTAWDGRNDVPDILWQCLTTNDEENPGIDFFANRWLPASGVDRPGGVLDIGIILLWFYSLLAGIGNDIIDQPNDWESQPIVLVLMNRFLMTILCNERYTFVTDTVTDAFATYQWPNIGMA